MQALFYNTFVLWCLLNTTILFAHNSFWIDTLANEAAQQYVEEFKDIAVIDMHKTGIPASIKLAQAMFESNFGRSDLAIRGNNHFGIKCYKSWKGGRLYYNDDKPNECFRQYDWVEDSYADHSRIITSKKRYASLFELAPIDYKGWAKGLQKSGYATDPQYANKLVWMIEKHNLHQYDFEEPPVFDSDEMPIIANADDIYEPAEIFYAYKFGDVEKPAPEKLIISKVSREKLIAPNEVAPKAQLLNVSKEQLEEKASVSDKNAFASKKITPPMKDKILEESAIPVVTVQRNMKMSPLLPKRHFQAVKELDNNHTFISISPFTKRKLPKLTLLIDTPNINQKVMEATIANPSADTNANITSLLTKKEFTYSNKLKVVQYEEAVQLNALAATYQITIEELKRYNDLSEDAQIFPQFAPVYLEAKKNKPAENHHKEHIVKEKETMWSIAQLYGIQLESLMKRNYLKAGEEPRVGETILLRSQAPYPPMIKREKPKANVSETFKQSVLEKIQQEKVKVK